MKLGTHSLYLRASWLALLAFAALSGCGDNKSPLAADASPDTPMPDAPGPTLDPVTGLTATPGTGGQVDLAWTNPTGSTYAGTIIVRHLIDPVDATPTDGTTYTASDTLAAGDVVVYAGTGTSFQDTAPPGRIHYAAFARDAAGAWTAPARANALVAAGAQTATLTIDVAGQSVTVTQQPADYVLAATAAYDSTGQTVTVQLSATSGFARNVFSPKAEITSLGQGAVTGDGTLDTYPFFRLGTGIAPAGTGQGTFTITGVDGTVDPLIVNLTLVDHPMAIVFPRFDADNAYELFDTGTLTSMGTVPCDSLLYVDAGASQKGNCSYRAGGLSADARRLYTGFRSLPVVRAIDPATSQVVATVTLATSGLGAVRAVALDPAGTHLYALLTLGGHAYVGDVNGNAAATEDQVLVQIDPATMTETARVTLVSAATQGTARFSDLDVSPDGTRVALADHNDSLEQVRIVDTSTMTEVDTDAGTAGVQPVDLSSVFTNYVRRVRYSPSGDTLYVQDQDGAVLATVDTATFAVGSIALTGTGTANAGGLFVDADGKVYVGYGEGTQSFTQLDGTTQNPGAAIGRAMAISTFGGRVFVSTASFAMHVYDAATLTEVDTGGGAPLTNHPAHDLLFTPF